MSDVSIQIIDNDESGNARIRKATQDDIEQLMHEADEQRKWEQQPIKRQTIESLERYRLNRIPTGDFLYAVLTNDLKGACSQADFENGKRIWQIVAWCYNNLPAESWGSPEKVEAWLSE